MLPVWRRNLMLACLALQAACGADDVLPRFGASKTVAQDPLDGGTPEQLADRAATLFRALEPDLTTTCGGACHSAGTAAGMPPTWLAKPDPYASIRAYPGIVVPQPDTSRLLVKGPHDGPALAAAQNQALSMKVREWLSAESMILKKVVLPSTDPFALKEGDNTIDISKGGVDLAFAQITFSAAFSKSILTLSSMKLVSPASVGVHLQHPVFVIVPETGPEKRDSVDSFSNVDVVVPPGSSSPVGPGQVLLLGWSNGSKLRIEFTKLEAVKGLADAGAGGCKSVATFVSSAVPAIQGNTCLTCHAGTNAGATGALDLSKVGKDDAAACAQARNKIDLTMKANSALIKAPTGGSQHPYTVPNAMAWTAAINGWIANE